MTKPLKKKYLGGTLTFTAKGDEYSEFGTGKVRQYEKTTVKFQIESGPKDVKLVVLPRDVFIALAELIEKDPEVQAKLKDWE